MSDKNGFQIILRLYKLEPVWDAEIPKFPQVFLHVLPRFDPLLPLNYSRRIVPLTLNFNYRNQQNDETTKTKLIYKEN